MDHLSKFENDMSVKNERRYSFVNSRNFTEVYFLGEGDEDEKIHK